MGVWDKCDGKGDWVRPMDKHKYDKTLDKVWGERDFTHYQKDKEGKKGFNDPTVVSHENLGGVE